MESTAQAAAAGTKEVELVSQNLGLGQLFQTFFSLLLVILLIIAIAWIMRRSGRFGSALGGQLRAVGGLSLGGRDRILLIDAAGTHLLIGISPAGIRTLHVFEEPLELDDQDLDKAPPDFSRALQRVLKQRAGPDEQ